MINVPTVPIAAIHSGTVPNCGVIGETENDVADETSWWWLRCGMLEAGYLHFMGLHLVLQVLMSSAIHVPSGGAPKHRMYVSRVFS